MSWLWVLYTRYPSKSNSRKYTGVRENKIVEIGETFILHFSCGFSNRIEQSSKPSKIQPSCIILGWIFEVCSILTEFFRHPTWPPSRETILKSNDSSAPYSEISVHDLMTICRVLLLIIGQNDTNPKLLQLIVASIYKVMTVHSLTTFSKTPISLLEDFSILNFLNFHLNNYFYFHVCLSFRPCPSVCPKTSSNSCNSITKCHEWKSLGMCHEWKICILSHPQTPVRLLPPRQSQGMYTWF